MTQQEQYEAIDQNKVKLTNKVWFSKSRIPLITQRKGVLTWYDNRIRLVQKWGNKAVFDIEIKEITKIEAIWSYINIYTSNFRITVNFMPRYILLPFVLAFVFPGLLDLFEIGAIIPLIVFWVVVYRYEKIAKPWVSGFQKAGLRNRYGEELAADPARFKRFLKTTAVIGFIMIIAFVVMSASGLKFINYYSMLFGLIILAFVLTKIYYKKIFS